MELVKLAVAVFFLPLLVQAQQSHYAASVRVVVQDSVLLEEGEIEFKLYPDGIHTDLTAETKPVTHRISRTAEQMEVPLSAALSYVRITCRFKGQEQAVGMALKPFNYDNNLFILRDGDNITLFLNRDTVAFGGRGSEKYACSLELSRHMDFVAAHRVEEENDLKKGLYSSYLAACARHQDSLYQVRKKVLDRYRPLIERDVFPLLQADIWGDYNRALLSRMFAGTSRVVKPYGPGHHDAVKEAYREYESGFNGRFLPDSILARSFKYADFLFWKEYAAEQVFNPMDQAGNAPSPFLYRYHAIQKHYSGIIRDKVNLLNFYFSKSTRRDLDLVREEAVAQTGHEPYKRELLRFIESRTGQAYAFELPDKEGKIHKLSDLKGKLIVMDFWYTGCINCVELAEKLKPIVREFKSNPGIVFLSVSIDGDKNRQVWLRSLALERYSSPDEINLLAQGKDAEIIKHYNIQGYPTLLVISKEGRVITLRPPDPRTDSQGFVRFLKTNL